MKSFILIQAFLSAWFDGTAFPGASATAHILCGLKMSYALNAEDVLSKIGPQTRLLMILNSQSNPTSGVAPFDQLEKLAKGLEAWPQVRLLSDKEIYSRLYFDGLKHGRPLIFENLRNRTIVLDGWSKTYAMTGWRLGAGLTGQPS